MKILYTLLGVYLEKFILSNSTHRGFVYLSRHIQAFCISRRARVRDIFLIHFLYVRMPLLLKL